MRDAAENLSVRAAAAEGDVNSLLHQIDSAIDALQRFIEEEDAASSRVYTSMPRHAANVSDSERAEAWERGSAQIIEEHFRSRAAYFRAVVPALSSMLPRLRAVLGNDSVEVQGLEREIDISPVNSLARESLLSMLSVVRGLVAYR
jgi:hypothetical protein